MDVGVPEILIILVVVILLFGVKRIGKIGGELGKSIRQFREGLQGEGEPRPVSSPASSASAPAPASGSDQNQRS